MKIVDVRNHDINACAKIPAGKLFELSISTIASHPELCVFRSTQNITERIFGEGNSSVYPSADNIKQALDWLEIQAAF